MPNATTFWFFGLMVPGIHFLYKNVLDILDIFIKNGELFLVMKRGLYIGRFQPMQNGHLKVIKEALDEVDELIIVVGSSDKSFNRQNPLTAGERIEIIKSTLMDEGLENRLG